MRQSQEGRALRQFTLSTGKSAGRNSSGRITVFHRGGGSKRLQRRIDLKRSTSSMGIVERIEYDPNRSSRIAPVRWIEGVIQKNMNFFMNLDSKMLFLKLLVHFLIFLISICLLKMGVPLCVFCDTESEQTSSENDAGIGAQDGARPLGESASNLEGEPSSSKKIRVDPTHVGSSKNPPDQEQQPADSPVSSFSSFPSLSSIASLPSIDRSEREPSVQTQPQAAGPSEIPAQASPEAIPDIPTIKERLENFIGAFTKIKPRADFLMNVNEKLGLYQASPEKLQSIDHTIERLASPNNQFQSGKEASKALLKAVKDWEKAREES